MKVFSKPIQLILPKKSLLSPEYPAAVVAGNVEISQQIVDTLLGALGIQAASQGTMNNISFGNDQYQYYETVCGGSGAGPLFHGTSAVHTHMTNSRMTDPEIFESRYPVRLNTFKVRQGSGGAGKYKGGDGIERSFTFLEAMNLSILSTRRLVAPFGLSGGKDAKAGENSIIRANGGIEKVAGVQSLEVDPQDIFIMKTPGGGGYGV
ncbi:hydantoinase B/oxoprolinase family protein [Piscirickettsia litoralis]|uniref:hydantoinase B/oxoprolinase family protein n=1 Tax=Piscirickettsia litoralis TaxID=1891921 RepID=UPI001F2BC4D5|nr:hydantoinase B/oxoprolinase family protein [Piscirickettsia litoralis]